MKLNTKNQRVYLTTEERTGLIRKVEHLVGSKIIDPLVQSRVYQYNVDGFANNVSSLVFALNELFIADMSVPETARARGTAFVGNMIVGRPYGIFRDFWFKKFHVTEESSRTKKFLTDMSAFAVGQAPIYAAYLFVATTGWATLKAGVQGNVEDMKEAFRHTPWKGMLKGAAMLTTVSPLIGSWTGLVYNEVRHQLGLKRSYELARDQHE